MNFDQHKIDAATRAAFCRASGLVRAMGVACALCWVALPAHAGHGDKERMSQAKQANQERRHEQRAQQAAPAQAQAPVQRQGEPLRNETRQFSYEARAEEHRRVLQAQQDPNARGGDATRRSGRLTADERRDLRRQINEAGMDLYPHAPRR